MRLGIEINIEKWMHLNYSFLESILPWHYESMILEVFFDMVVLDKIKEETPEGKDRFYTSIYGSVGFSGGSDGQESACNPGDRVQSLGGEDILEKGMATHSTVLAWRILWTEEPGRLESMGS